jgi:hypothetical protein
MGKREFSFRITSDVNVCREAQIYNEAPTALSFFPEGSGKPICDSALTIDNDAVSLSSCRRTEEGYVLTVFNSSDHPQHACIKLAPIGKTVNVDLGKWEFKFITIA